MSIVSDRAMLRLYASSSMIGNTCPIMSALNIPPNKVKRENRRCCKGNAHFAVTSDFRLHRTKNLLYITGLFFAYCTMPGNVQTWGGFGLKLLQFWPIEFDGGILCPQYQRVSPPAKLSGTCAALAACRTANNC